MKKFLKIMAITSLLSISMTTAAFAGTWKQSDQGKWWWQEDDKSYPASTWEWIDSDGNGLAECYYFDENGYLLTGITTPDGYRVNDSGAWVDQGIVCQKATTPNAVNAMRENGIQILQAANQKFSQLDSVDVKAKAECNFSYQGMTIPINMDLLMKIHNLHDSNMEFLASANMNMLNQSYDFNVFYTKGYLYTKFNDNKEKSKLDYSYIAEALNEVNLTKPNWELYKNIQVETDENGNKILTYSVDQEKLFSILNDFDYPKDMMSDMQKFKFSQLEGKIVINPEGYFTNNVVTINATYTEDGESANISIKLNVDYRNPGQPVSIELPSTEGYEEYT